MTHYDKEHIGDIVANKKPGFDWFSCDLIRLIARADGVNQAKLAQVYPREVRAYLEWRDRSTDWRNNV